MQKAMNLEALGKVEDAIETLQALVDQKRPLLASSDEVLVTEYWTFMLPELSDWYMRKHNYEAAEPMAREILEHCYEHGYEHYAATAVHDLLGVYEATDRQHEATELVVHLANKSEGPRSWLVALLGEYVLDRFQERYVPRVGSTSRRLESADLVRLTGCCASLSR